MSLCTLCDAIVEWKTTVTGQRLPIDPAPHPDGAIAMRPSGVIFVIPMEDRPGFVGTRYHCHWTNCPAQAAAKQGAGKGKP